MESLADEFPKEQARVRKLLGHYRDIGPAGMFGAIMIEAALCEADAAAMSGDIVRMVKAYEDLRGFKD